MTIIAAKATIDLLKTAYFSFSFTLRGLLLFSTGANKKMKIVPVKIKLRVLKI